MSPALREDGNRLEVRVSTAAANYCRSLTDANPMAKRWCLWYPPLPAGLVGPVSLAKPMAGGR